MLSRTTVDRLANEGIRAARDLPSDRDQLRVLSRRCRVPVSDLAFAGTVAGLMKDLRISEVTAGCLAVAGLTSKAAVASAPREKVRRAVEHPGRLPDSLSRRPVNPAVVELIVERAA